MLEAIYKVKIFISKMRIDELKNKFKDEWVLVEVLEIDEVGQPVEIKIFVSPKWKYKFIEIFKKEIEKTRDIRALIQTLMKEKDLKPYGKDISKMIPSLLKDASKVPSEVLTQELEFKNLEETKKLIAKEFNCNIEIEKAEQSKEQKANNASPSKPAIIIQ